MLITQLPNILLTLAIAFCAGWLVMRLKVPGGMMLGAMIGVLLFNVFTGLGSMPYIARFISQSIAGAYIGCSLNRKELKHIPRLWGPLCILVVGMIAVNIITAWIFVHVSPLDGVTAMLAAMPGGVNETPMIAADMGADAAKVTALQFVRMIAGLGIYPMVIRLMDRMEQKQTVEERGILRVEDMPAVDTAPPQNKNIDLRRVVLTMAVALIGAYFGRQTGFPAGLLIFSMLATGVLNLSTGAGEMVKPLKRFAQLLAGAYIGCLMGYKDVVELQYVLLPAVAMIMMFAINCVFSSYLIHKLCGFKRREAMLATTPAGASEIALISSDMGVEGTDVADIVLLHTVRLIVIISVIPQIIPLVIRLF